MKKILLFILGLSYIQIMSCQNINNINVIEDIKCLNEEIDLSIMPKIIKQFRNGYLLMDYKTLYFLKDTSLSEIYSTNDSLALSYYINNISQLGTEKKYVTNIDSIKGLYSLKEGSTIINFSVKNDSIINVAVGFLAPYLEENKRTFDFEWLSIQLKYEKGKFVKTNDFPLIEKERDKFIYPRSQYFFDDSLLIVSNDNLEKRSIIIYQFDKSNKNYNKKYESDLWTVTNRAFRNQEITKKDNRYYIPIGNSLICYSGKNQIEKIDFQNYLYQIIPYKDKNEYQAVFFVPGEKKKSKKLLFTQLDKNFRIIKQSEIYDTYHYSQLCNNKYLDIKNHNDIKTQCLHEFKINN